MIFRIGDVLFAEGAGLKEDLLKSNTSFFVILPLIPVPFTCSRFMDSSSANFRTAGEILG